MSRPQRRIFKKVDVASPPNPVAREFAEKLRKYFPVHMIPKTGGGLDITLTVYAGRQPQRFTIMSGVALEGVTVERLTEIFWINYKQVRRQKMWFGWR